MRVGGRTLILGMALAGLLAGAGYLVYLGIRARHIRHGFVQEYTSAKLRTISMSSCVG